MSKAIFNCMCRAIKGRMANGETFDEIIANYPKLTSEEIENLRKACEG